jgi:hypothetical protein
MIRPASRNCTGRGAGLSLSSAKCVREWSKYSPAGAARAPAMMNNRMKDDKGARLLAYVTGLVNQEFLLRNVLLFVPHRSDVFASHGTHCSDMPAVPTRVGAI